MCLNISCFRELESSFPQLVSAGVRGGGGGGRRCGRCGRSGGVGGFLQAGAGDGGAALGGFGQDARAQAGRGFGLRLEPRAADEMMSLPVLVLTEGAAVSRRVTAAARLARLTAAVPAALTTTQRHDVNDHDLLWLIRRYTLQY